MVYLGKMELQEWMEFQGEWDHREKKVAVENRESKVHQEQMALMEMMESQVNLGCQERKETWAMLDRLGSRVSRVFREEMAGTALMEQLVHLDLMVHQVIKGFLEKMASLGHKAYQERWVFQVPMDHRDPWGSLEREDLQELMVLLVRKAIWEIPVNPDRQEFLARRVSQEIREQMASLVSRDELDHLENKETMGQ